MVFPLPAAALHILTAAAPHRIPRLATAIGEAVAQARRSVIHPAARTLRLTVRRHRAVQLLHLTVHLQVAAAYPDRIIREAATGMPAIAPQVTISAAGQVQCPVEAWDPAPVTAIAAIPVPPPVTAARTVVPVPLPATEDRTVVPAPTLAAATMEGVPVPLQVPAITAGVPMRHPADSPAEGITAATWADIPTDAVPMQTAQAAGPHPDHVPMPTEFTVMVTDSPVAFASILIPDAVPSLTVTIL